MDKATAWLIGALVWCLGCFFGYAIAHGTVARECVRLGGFYVGNATFECKTKR